MTISKKCIMSVKFVVTIDAKASKVWAVLTSPFLMTQWMGSSEMKVEVETDWKINAPLVVRGFHHVKFENKGVVLRCIPEEQLTYSHLSSVSRLPDETGNYTILDFILTPTGNRTILTLGISNFPTEIIRKHLEFYWRGTMHRLKKCVENDEH